MSTSEQITAVIPVMDAEPGLPQLLTELRAAHVNEITIVANGTPEANRITAAQARRAGAHLLGFDEPLGHDVGRAVGAHVVRAGAILFIDADLHLTAAQIAPFVEAMKNGVDVALNRIDPFIPAQARLHPVYTAKRFLNCALHRPDLGCASLTAVPHALSESALRTIGTPALAVPPKALAMALVGGLRVEAVHPVDVVRGNPARPGVNTGQGNPVEQLIIGDHLEALDWALGCLQDPRGGFTDLWRRREQATL